MNLTTVERFIAACNEEDDLTAWAILDPAVRVQVSGSTWFSGCFAGEEQIRRILLSTVRQFVRTARISALEMIAEDAYVAGLIELSIETRTGREFARAGSPWGICFELAHGRIAGIEVFSDTMFLETFVCNATYQSNHPEHPIDTP